MFEPYVQNVWGSKRSHWREGNCLGRQPCTRTTFCANVDCLSWVILQSQALVHCTRKSGLYKAFHRPPHRLRALVRIVTVEDPRRMPNTPSPQGMTGAHCNSQLRLQPMHDTSSKTSDSLNSMLICIPTIYRKWFTDHPIGLLINAWSTSARTILTICGTSWLVAAWSTLTPTCPKTVMLLFCIWSGMFTWPPPWTRACSTPSMPKPCSRRRPKHKIGWDTLEEIATLSFSTTDRPVEVGSLVSTSLMLSIGIVLPCALHSLVPFGLIGIPASIKVIGKTEASAPESSMVSSVKSSGISSTIALTPIGKLAQLLSPSSSSPIRKCITRTDPLSQEPAVKSKTRSPALSSTILATRFRATVQPVDVLVDLVHLDVTCVKLPPVEELWDPCTTDCWAVPTSDDCPA